MLRLFNQQSITSGFTLLELLVVFSIIAIVTGLGFASLVSYSRNRTVVQAASNFRQAVDKARFNAISIIKPSSCTSTDEVDAYIVNLCNPTCSDGFSNGYETVADCRSHVSPAISQTKFPSNVSFSTVGVTPTPPVVLCSQISFNTVRPNAGGVPCSINVVGLGITAKVFVNNQGYVSVTY